MATKSRAFGPNVVIGLGLAGVGVALLLDRLRLVEARTALQYWPLLIILFGASVVWQEVLGRADGAPQRPVLSPGLVLLFVIAGVMAVRADFYRPNRIRTSTSDTINVSAVLGSSRHTSEATRFRGADVMTVMGASRLDLRKATIPEGEEAVIDVFTLMGGVELLVPPQLAVVTDIVPVLGGVEDRRARQLSGDDESSERDDRRRRRASRRSRQSARDEEPGESGSDKAAKADATEVGTGRLVVRGSVTMGEVEIKLR